MSADDDAAYRKSVRNMSVVLALIIMTVFAAIFIPPYFSPAHIKYQSSVSLDSPFGFTLHLKLNTTSMPRTGSILLTGWLNSTSSGIQNITAANAWALSQSRLWGRICTTGWPIGLGVMAGHYTNENYTLGTVIPIPMPLLACLIYADPPHYYLLEPHSSNALVMVSGNPTVWNIQTSLLFRMNYMVSQLHPGVYTAVVADEWGDVLTTNFLVT
jgi:hypothetical protein